MVFAERFKLALKRADKTHREVADHLGLDRSTVSHWALGRNTPNPETLAKLARYLGVSADYLCGLEDEEWLYELPPYLLEFVREEAMKGHTYLVVAEELKKSGLDPDTIQRIVDVLEADRKAHRGN